MNQPSPAAITDTGTATIKQKNIYLPGLNGIRAIAALAVVVSHTTLALEEFGLKNTISLRDANGKAIGLSLAANGVTIFFTLSGFLITYLLLKEKEIRPLKVKDFYIRRLLRIWPLYYLYLFAAITTAVVSGILVNSGTIPFYIFLAANVPFILETPLRFLNHYWSLGVEEQFYLFFPQLARWSNKFLLRATVILIAFLFSLQIVFWLLFKYRGIDLPLRVLTVTRFHIMLIGVLAAILYYSGNKFFLRATTHIVSQVLAWGCLLLIAVNKFHLISLIDSELVAVMSVVLIMGQITKTNPFINLENKLFDFVGKISYGIYVIHPLLIYFCAKAIGPFRENALINYIIVFTVVIAVTLIVAWMSYEFYEKRFLKLKSKFTAVKSSSTRNAE
jgi:peptidoglycan/LPS O-acetylase OafA/YrhL